MIQRKTNSSLNIGTLPAAPQRQGMDQNSPLHPRAGAPKKSAIPAINSGTPKRREEYEHPLAGPTAKRPLMDEPLQKSHIGKGNVPTAHGMKVTPRGDDQWLGHHDPKMGNAILDDAARLGRSKK